MLFYVLAANDEKIKTSERRVNVIFFPGNRRPWLRVCDEVDIYGFTPWKEADRQGGGILIHPPPSFTRLFHSDFSFARLDSRRNTLLEV